MARTHPVEGGPCHTSGALRALLPGRVRGGGAQQEQHQRRGLLADLQLDRLKQKLARRVFLLQSHQDKEEFRDKLSPIVVSLNLTLVAAQGTDALGLVLYGDTLVQEQTHIVLDCGEDNICIPDLRLAADTPGTRLLIGAENVVHLRINASNAGEGAFEAELRVQLQPSP
nr:PREDICTED: integrin alpha-IIb-like [Struthio camelus australis]